MEQVILPVKIMYQSGQIGMELIMKATTQIERDIAFCIDELELTNYQIGELLRATEKLGNIPVEYFCDEFIFDCDRDEDEFDRIHDNHYLHIEQFNALYEEDYQ